MKKNIVIYSLILFCSSSYAQSTRLPAPKMKEADPVYVKAMVEKKYGKFTPKYYDTSKIAGVKLKAVDPKQANIKDVKLIGKEQPQIAPPLAVDGRNQPPPPPAIK